MLKLTSSHFELGCWGLFLKKEVEVYETRDGCVRFVVV